MQYQNDELRNQHQEVYRRIDSLNSRLQEKDEESAKLKNELIKYEGKVREVEAGTAGATNELTNLKIALQSKHDHLIHL